MIENGTLSNSKSVAAVSIVVMAIEENIYGESIVAICTSFLLETPKVISITRLPKRVSRNGASASKSAR
jgi:hypothetical protein